MTELGDRQPWEKMQGEPDAHYAWFLVYRNLGISRTIDMAYTVAALKSGKARKSRKASGTWTEAAVNWNWVERANKWDVAVLSEAGWKVMATFVAGLQAHAEKVLAALQDPRNKPRGWKGATEALSVLAGFIPPETFAAICANPAGPGPVVGSAGGGAEGAGLPAAAQTGGAAGVDGG